ncbi:MAG: hypothetical protein CVU52_03860 [Deltaproteobacteria bacterium HGW-Deltaproteobacteria-10]|nr:MAG: hypothetical protein CVU52_03860 [Deltaproteobacteria bacterium HGW-Deltaproteobacteria-10]
MKTYAIKYLELIDQHAEKMAARWSKDVRSNSKTKYYQLLDEQKIISQCVRFYQYFSKMFIDDKLSEDILHFFKTYARESYALKIPLDEAVYALILMRRNIWLYVEFQSIFTTAIDQQQAVDTLSRTILLFDYASYDITKEYQELMKKETEKKK